MTTRTGGALDAARQAGTAGKIDAAESVDAGSGEGQPSPKKRQAMRQDGLQIDGFGLPVNGVARKRILAEMKQEDPAVLTIDWNDALAGKARKLTEKHYG